MSLSSCPNFIFICWMSDNIQSLMESFNNSFIENCMVFSFSTLNRWSCCIFSSSINLCFWTHEFSVSYDTGSALFCSLREIIFFCFQMPFYSLPHAIPRLLALHNFCHIISKLTCPIRSSRLWEPSLLYFLFYRLDDWLLLDTLYFYKRNPSLWQQQFCLSCNQSILFLTYQPTLLHHILKLNS